MSPLEHSKFFFTQIFMAYIQPNILLCSVSDNKCDFKRTRDNYLTRKVREAANKKIYFLVARPLGLTPPPSPRSLVATFFQNVKKGSFFGVFPKSLKVHTIIVQKEKGQTVLKTVLDRERERDAERQTTNKQITDKQTQKIDKQATRRREGQKIGVA